MPNESKPGTHAATPSELFTDVEEVESSAPARPGKGSVKATAHPARIDAHIEALRERTMQMEMKKLSAFESRVLQDVFPFWDDDHRGVPNPLVRSGLFSVRNGVKRNFEKGLQVASLSNYQIEYSGEELQQDDLSVWMSLVNLARQQPMSDTIFFSGYQIVKDLGWRMHSDSYQRVQACIDRLQLTSIRINSKKGDASYAGSLIRERAWKEEGKRGEGERTKWMVRFEPKVSMLFLEDTTTLLEWEVRKRIGPRSTVALFLHSFFSSHREPLPIPVAKLHELSRSSAALSVFRRNLKNALETLKKVEFLSSFHIENDTVYVQKRMRASLTAVAAGKTKAPAKLPSKPKQAAA